MAGRSKGTPLRLEPAPWTFPIKNAWRVEMRWQHDDGRDETLGFVEFVRTERGVEVWALGLGDERELVHTFLA